MSFLPGTGRRRSRLPSIGNEQNPVHEAMARLQEDGLVRILPKKGIIICALSPADIEEIYEVIIALEGAAAARLAQLQMKERTPVVQILQSATASMVGALAENDLEAWAAADERFHEELVAEWQSTSHAYGRHGCGSTASRPNVHSQFTSPSNPLFR